VTVAPRAMLSAPRRRIASAHQELLER